MATIQLTDDNWTWYKKGVSGYSKVFGYESSSRRVARCKFTAPASGATGINISIYSSGKGGGSHIPIKFYIGTDPNSHANAGSESTATGTLTLGDDWMTFTGNASMLLIPNQVYYLWIFPGSDSYGWYNAARPNYTSTIITSGAAMSVISGSNGTLGTSHKLTLTRYSTAMIHTITATCGKASLTIKTGVQADSLTWTPPITWAAQNTTGTTVSAKITCTTYNGSSAVGSTSVTLTFSIPSSVAPTATISVSDKQGYLSKYGNYIQGKSQAQISAKGTGAQGSTISSYSISAGTVTKSGESPVFDLSTAGDITFKVTVTDSRGRTGSASVTITVAAYTPPAVSISAVYRCDADGNEDSDGTYAIAVFSASVTDLGNKNSASYALKYRIRGTTTWLDVPASSLSGNYTPSSVSMIIPISTENGYELSIEVTDDFGPILSAYRTIQVAFSMADFDRAHKAIGFGQRANTANTVSFGLPAMFNKGVAVTPISVSSFDVIDSALSGIVDKLETYSIDFCVFIINGQVWHCILFKQDSQYATAEFYSFAGRRRKVLTAGTWGNTISIR